MTLTAKSEIDNLQNSSHLAALYAKVDAGRKNFDFYVPAYPLGVLQWVGDKLYHLPTSSHRRVKVITIGFNWSVTSYY